jgi:alkylated DNA repair dioxygenase AlkB
VTNVRSIARIDRAGWSPSLFSLGPPEVDAGFTNLDRRHLDGGAWVDHAPEWLSGSERVFDTLVDALGWAARQVPMYGELVDEPRLTAGWPGPTIDPVVGPLVEEVRGLLSDRYHQSLRSTWANLYRDGRDSVAWHGDRVLREQRESLVAIVSLGARRPFRLRPRGGGSSIGFDLGQGDLLVMGGTCQRTWQHGVPKVRACGPRLSLSFRAAPPRPAP